MVNPGVMKKLAQYYSSFVTEGDVYSMFSIPAEHAMVGNLKQDCKTSGWRGELPPRLQIYYLSLP